jgi:predicted TIM-barrel fold metal-dependent hydrolase
MMIIDVHTHIFPYLGESSGFDSIETHLKYLQKFTSVAPASAIRRVADGEKVSDPELARVWNDQDKTFQGAYDVKFRVGRFGRLEWTRDGVDYYVHLYAPNFQEMVSSPEFLLAQMDYIGVQKAVLQNAWLYGQMNDFFSQAVKRYPDRFIGTVQVNESKADQHGEIGELRRAVIELGLKALYFANERFFETGFADNFDDEKFYPFWEEVRRLKIPVFWDLSAIQEPDQKPATPFERYIRQLRRLDNVLKVFPEIPSILVHGVPMRYIRKGDEFEAIPNEIWQIWQRPNVFVEILFPMQVSHPVPGGTIWDYPYQPVQPVIQQLYQKLGAEKLLWGSDMPNVERNCTYRQSLEYLTRYSTSIPAADMDKIIGQNAWNLLKDAGMGKSLNSPEEVKSASLG